MTASASFSGPWRDLTDPRRAATIDDLEAGLKEPIFENLEIPERLGPVTITVDDHKIKRFAFTQDDYSPWSLQDSPFGGRIGQPALLGNDLLQLFTTRYRASRTVGFHTEEQMWFDSPVKVGEVVTLAGEYVESYVRRGEGYVVMEASAVAEDGRTIVRHRGVEILKTVPGAIGGRGSGTPEKRVTGEVPDSARRIDVIDSDTRVGDVLVPLVKTITFEQTAVFSRLGEYVTNTHNSLAAAREGKLAVPIVQGQQQFGLIAQLLVRAFGAGFFTGGWMRVKFLVPVDVFEPLTISGVVTAISAADDGSLRAELEVWARRADGRLVAVGWASAPVPSQS